MRRREFFTLLGGAVTWPRAAGAQAERMRRTGVLMAISEDDPLVQESDRCAHHPSHRLSDLADPPNDDRVHLRLGQAQAHSQNRLSKTRTIAQLLGFSADC
jgi:hypothetical protein